MAMPLAGLAVPSVLIGLLGTPWHSRFAELLDPHEAAEMAEHFSWSEFLPLAGASVGISVAGISLAVLAYYLHRIDLGQTVAARFPAVNAFFANKWYLDAINERLFVQGSRKMAKQVLNVDSKVVDGVVNLTRPTHPRQGRRPQILRNRPGPVLCPDRVRRRDRPGGAVQRLRLRPASAAPTARSEPIKSTGTTAGSRQADKQQTTTGHGVAAEHRVACKVAQSREPTHNDKTLSRLEQQPQMNFANLGANAGIGRKKGAQPRGSLKGSPRKATQNASSCINIMVCIERRCTPAPGLSVQAAVSFL
jgi:hypothetical protein